MSQIDKIISNVLSSKNQDLEQHFLGCFKELYKIPKFKTGLDVILTKAEAGMMKFELYEPHELAAIHGCSITVGNISFSQKFKSFIRKQNHLIKIKTINVAVLAHEIAHVLEFESRLNIKQGFKPAFQKDLLALENAPLMIKQAIKQIMFTELQLYRKEQYDSEFLARYFELLARSKEIGGYSDNFHFKFAEILKIFRHTNEWIQQVFNHSLLAQTRSHIRNMTEQIEYDQNLQDHSRKAHNRKKTGENWRKTTGSIFN